MRLPVVSKNHLVALASLARDVRSTGVLPSPSNLIHPHVEASFSNWLIPHYLAIGQYPYPVRSIPESDSSELPYTPARSACEAHLRGLMRDHRLRVFCSLQHELPNFGDEFKLTEVNRDGGDRLGETGQYPTLITESGASLQCYKADAAGFAYDLGLDAPLFLHFPIVDLGVPSPQVAAACLQGLLGRMRQGEPVYVHCWGGRGRAGTIGALLLALVYPELGAEEVLGFVQAGYDSRSANSAGGSQEHAQHPSPETEEQSDFVRTFAASVSSATGRPLVR